MNSDKLLELITLGENSQIEFKSGEFRNESLAKEQDIPEYEPFVVRELIVNAFAHRDWSIFGQRIRKLINRALNKWSLLAQRQAVTEQYLD